VVRSHRSARFGWKKEMIQQAYNLCLLANSSAVVSGDCTTDEVDRLLGRQHLQILVLFCYYLGCHWVPFCLYLLRACLTSRRSSEVRGGTGVLPPPCRSTWTPLSRSVYTQPSLWRELLVGFGQDMNRDIMDVARVCWCWWKRWNTDWDRVGVNACNWTAGIVVYFFR
jgi:hypothetical protein